MMGKTNSIIRTGLRIFLIQFFLFIISFQTLGTIRITHVPSGGACTCGCLEEGGSCYGSCCSVESFSNCECEMPSDTEVVFVLPTTLDHFILNRIPNESTSETIKQYHMTNSDTYESVILSPPTPIPIG